MMKKISLALNAVLLIAVIVLYVLFFTQKKGSSASEGQEDALLTGTSLSEGIVFINIDSVLNKYDMYADLQTELQNKLKTSEAQLASKEKNYRKAYEDLQYKVSKQLVTRSEAEQLQQGIMQQEQELH